MRLSNFMAFTGFLVVAATLAACGKSVDARLLEGTWRLDRTEGNGRAVQGFRIQNGRFSPLLEGGRFDCATPYRVSGSSLVIDANTTAGCRFAAIDINIDSVTQDTLVLREGGFRAFYRKDGGGNEPTGTGPGYSPGSRRP